MESHDVTPLPSAARTIFVSIDGSDTNSGDNLDNAFATFRTAIAAAVDGDVVEVSPGDYDETPHLDRSIAFMGVLGEENPTLLNGIQLGSTEKELRGVRIQGFTVRKTSCFHVS